MSLKRINRDDIASPRLKRASSCPRRYLFHSALLFHLIHHLLKYLFSLFASGLLLLLRKRADLIHRLLFLILIHLDLLLLTGLFVGVNHLIKICEILFAAI